VSANFDGLSNRKGRPASFGRGEDELNRAGRVNGRVTPAVDDLCGAIEYLPTRRLARSRSRHSFGSWRLRFGYGITIMDRIL